MSLTGGKRKVNKGLKDWVTFVKKVQKEEKLSYKDAIHRAKVRKDKGEKWMSGGQGTSTTSTPLEDMGDMGSNDINMGPNDMGTNDMAAVDTMGGRKRRTMRRSLKRSKNKSKSRTARRGRGRASRRH